ncbi:TPA: phage terminase large subunit family protein, partial [Escherichia coli]
ASESPHFMRFHVACPHCGEEQYLKFGDKETPFGLKWTPDDPSSVFYLCEHNACVIRQQELDFTDARCKFRNNVGNFGGFLSINKLSQ